MTSIRLHLRHVGATLSIWSCLTNAPATFQGLMNEVFNKYLLRFLLVFFDILIYSKVLQHHLLIWMVLLTMRRNSLYAKKSKCYFGLERSEYLGHFILKKMVYQLTLQKSWLSRIGHYQHL